MCLAETHTRMDVKRVEHHRVATLSACDLLRGGVGKGVGTADDERVECQTRVEWGTTERFMHARVAHHQRPAVSTTIRIARAHVADAKVGLSLGQHRGLQDRRAYDQ